MLQESVAGYHVRLIWGDKKIGYMARTLSTDSKYWVADARQWRVSSE